MAATLWDSFEDLLQKAEHEFLGLHFDQAMRHWSDYYKITAKTEYQKIIDEIRNNWNEDVLTSVNSLSRLLHLFLELRNKSIRKEISHYTYRLYLRLYLNHYLSRFQQQAQQEVSLESGVFEYLVDNYDSAIEKLKSVIRRDVESVHGRIFLGLAYMAKKEQRPAIAVLTQNLFLAADQLQDDDLYLSQFKMLLGRLFADSGNMAAASWQLVFESWYRSYLIIEEDNRFFLLMQQKEGSERIMRVKYYAVERYRHFMRCLFVAEYARLFLKNKKGLILDQEKYMEQLDLSLFERYRKKRKAIK